MLRFNTYFLIFLAAIIMMGCKKDKTSPVPNASGVLLRVSPNWDGGVFTANEEYHNAMDYRVFIQAVKFYLSDIRAKRSGGDRFMNEISLFDITDGPMEVMYDLEPGSYNGIKFGIGVPPDLNGTNDVNFNPAAYPSDHPLSVGNGMYWTWTSGYRFVIFDGYYDTDPNGTSDVLPGFSIHSGLDTTYKYVEFNNVPFEVQQGEYVELELNLDVSRMFYNINDTIDLAIDNQSHGSNLQLAMRLMDNMVGAFELE